MIFLGQDHDMIFGIFSYFQVAAHAKAETEKILMVKAAEAEAEAKFLQGQGVAKQRAAIVEGLRSSLEEKTTSCEL